MNNYLKRENFIFLKGYSVKPYSKVFNNFNEIQKNFFLFISS
jgi:hypothetical protein